MIATLKSFTTETLFDATSALLSKLNIEFDRETAEPIDVAELYDSPMPKYLTEALQAIDKTYFIGIVNDQSLAGNKSNDSFDDVAETIEHGGKYDGMFIFACDASHDATLTRTAASALTRAFNRIACANPVILVIRQGNLLSLATCERMEYSQAWRQGSGEKLGKVNILRNINCLVPHRGHVDILNSLGEKTCCTFEELYKLWMDVFNSELLTKKFYNELSDWYAWAVMVAKFPNNIHTDEDDAKFNHESCIRLITRLIFVWFLKQKHLIPEEFFDENYIRENLIENFDPHDKKNLYYNADESKYYRLILQNLFFAMLNCPIVAEGKSTPNNRRFRGDSQHGFKRDGYNVNNLMRYKAEFAEGGADKFVKLANRSVPFLNGGLFDCLDDKPRALYYDGFSERKESLEQLFFPDYLFFGEEVGNGIDLSQWYDDKKKKNVSARGLIDILKRYSFTIEENTPYDQEVSLDPELLGKVFENLLAAYNPETKQSARKQTGSFYTPREIVQYMVDESLVAHLKRICGDEMEPQYRQLLNYGTEEVTLSEGQRKSIMNAIYNCRVLDPACGSGAFPMGVLQQMVHVLKRIDPTNEMWNSMMVDIAIEDARKELQKVTSGNEAEKTKIEENRKARLDDIESAFNQSVNDPDYARKLYLIEHCVYGVDIQPIAIQISKLRFFISLVVDQKPTKDAKTNFGIRPLPNLEAKFVTANTLIPLDRTKDLFTNTEDIRYYEEQLQDINHRIFLAKKNSIKKELQQLMFSTRAAMAQTMENLGAIGSKGYDQLMSWNMFDQNASASFFDPEWMFGVKDGFDVVIGNPPYVQLQANKGELADLYEAQCFSSFARTGDLYCLFYEKGVKCLTKFGFLCFITSNKWMKAGYGEKLRTFFMHKTNPLLLVDFGGYKVFKSASVDTNILILQNGNYGNKTKCYTLDSKGFSSLTNHNLYDIVNKNSENVWFKDSNSWVLMDSASLAVRNKIEDKGVLLRNWNVTINLGIKTGLNEAYVVNTAEKERILNNCVSNKEKEMTEGLFLKLFRGRDIQKYKSEWADLWLINVHNGIKGYLERIDINEFPTLKKYFDNYYTKLEKRGDKGDTPYNLRNCKYLDDFNAHKIVYSDISHELTFSYLEPHSVVNNTAYFFVCNDEYERLYLLNTLNSKLIDWYYRTLSVQLGSSAIRLFTIYMLELPIIPFDKSKDYNLHSSVDNVDMKVYHLYNLTYDEVLIIDPETPITREEYDDFKID